MISKYLPEILPQRMEENWMLMLVNEIEERATRMLPKGIYFSSSFLTTLFLL
jgi:hypothetical protein